MLRLDESLTGLAPHALRRRVGFDEFGMHGFDLFLDGGTGHDWGIIVRERVREESANAKWTADSRYLTAITKSDDLSVVRALLLLRFPDTAAAQRPAPDA